jgi:hypothetical protein
MRKHPPNAVQYTPNPRVDVKSGNQFFVNVRGLAQRPPLRR